MDLRKSGSHSQRPTAGLGDTKNKNADRVLGEKCYHLCSWELGYLLLPRGVSVYRDNVALFKKKK